MPPGGLLITGNPGSRVVAGLGNAENAYVRSRHNVGAMVVATALRGLGAQPRAGLNPLPGTRSGVVLPDGYMNESGRLVRRAVERWRPAPEGLLIVHDDMDLPFGLVQTKESGGHGGHNGLRDIVAVLGSGAFGRLRIGIGRPPGRMDPADFVLASFTAAEREDLEEPLRQAADSVVSFLKLPESRPPALV